MDNHSLDKIMTAAFLRTHRYSCAEATLQALQTIWDLPCTDNSWATAGFFGALCSGKSNCGLLVGTSVAIGLKCGQGLVGNPEENGPYRDKAIRAVDKLCKDFINEFGHADCKTVSGCDWSKPADVNRYVTEKIYKKICDPALSFVIDKCIAMEDDDNIIFLNQHSDVYFP
ncbi:MAG: hypothetical protein C0403_07435 [Desulfobacterium sp.]|nr:hypothetical protein [Desulfobacterium sp.]